MTQAPPPPPEQKFWVSTPTGVVAQTESELRAKVAAGTHAAATPVASQADNAWKTAADFGITAPVAPLPPANPPAGAPLPPPTVPTVPAVPAAPATPAVVADKLLPEERAKFDIYQKKVATKEPMTPLEMADFASLALKVGR